MTELKFKDELFLTRKDLILNRRDIPLAEIDMNDFRISKRCFASSSYVDFTDDDGTRKVLKSRARTPIVGKIVRLNVDKKRTDALPIRFDPNGVTEVSAKDILAML